MPPKPSKKTTEKPQETSAPVEQSQKQVQTPEQSQNIVTNWAGQTETKETKEVSKSPGVSGVVSVINFDRSEMEPLNEKKFSELETEQILKLLIMRADKEKNPIISGTIERVLQQINRERIPRKDNYKKKFYNNRKSGFGDSSNDGRDRRFTNTGNDIINPSPVRNEPIGYFDSLQTRSGQSGIVENNFPPQSGRQVQFRQPRQQNGPREFDTGGRSYGQGRRGGYRHQNSQVYADAQSPTFGVPNSN